MNNCILLRYGEIGLKSTRTRGHFEALYVKALEDALRRQGQKSWKIKNYGGRFVLFTDHVKELKDTLRRIPGIQSFSPAQHFSCETKEGILQTIRELATPLVTGKTFCVRIRRIGEHAFTSKDLETEAGSVLYEPSKGVDLHHPDIIIHLEIREKEGFLSTESFTGLGGLPPTSSGKVLLLFSGGLDSPVAAVQLLKRGCQVDFAFVNLQGQKALNDVARVYNYLAQHYILGYTPQFFEIPATELVEKIKEDVPRRLRQIALKIAFYALGEKISRQTGALAIATGEALSQKSTQTLHSLRVIEEKTALPVLRPLLSFDKVEIVRLAEDIGTRAASEKVKEYCNLSEGPVQTMPELSVLQRLPPLDKEIEQALRAKIVYRGMVPFEEEAPISLSPDQELIVVDIRPKHLQEQSPLAAARSSPYPFVLEELDAFPPGKSYLFVCDFGVQSENVAFLLRKKGISAAGISLPHYMKYFAKKTSKELERAQQ